MSQYIESVVSLMSCKGNDKGLEGGQLNRNGSRDR